MNKTLVLDYVKSTGKTHVYGSDEEESIKGVYLPKSLFKGKNVPKKLTFLITEDNLDLGEDE